MSVEKPGRSKPVIVGFDGLHRAGKGTQANLLASHLDSAGVSNVIVRGDGTREGLGDTPGDPYSADWQERSKRLKTYDRTVPSWNLASYILLRELHDLSSSIDAPEYILVDRSIMSRTSFLLHRGHLPVGSRATVEDLYPDANGEFDIADALPAAVFDLQTSNPTVLLDRVDKDDPKYDFRVANIKGGFQAAKDAINHVPEGLLSRIEIVDAEQGQGEISQHIIHRLGLTALK